MEEQRNVHVHSDLLDTLMTLKARLSESSIHSPGAKSHTSLSLHQLITTGTPPERYSLDTATNVDCALVEQDSTDAAVNSALGLGGLDPVLFVRHQGLPCVAVADVGCVRAPAQSGRLCVLL